MLGVVQLCLPSHQDWSVAWDEPCYVPGVVSELAERLAPSPKECANGAIHYLAGYLARYEFSLFRNGGQPLIERRTGDIQEEILVKVGSRPTKGSYIPMAFEVHVNHHKLRSVRERYWTAAGRPPVTLVSGNTGLLQEAPSHDIWNMATEDAFVELVGHFRGAVLPYLEMLASPNQMRRAIFDRVAPLFDPVTSVEWLLMEFGRSDAREFIQRLITDEEVSVHEFWMEHDVARNQKFIGVRNGEIAQSLAVIAVSHDLCRRWNF